MRNEFQGYTSDTGISTFVNVRSPERYSTIEVTEDSVRRESELKIARHEKTQLEAMMEMFAKMREEDRQERLQLEIEREQERIGIKKKNEQERQDREQERKKNVKEKKEKVRKVENRKD